MGRWPFFCFADIDLAKKDRLLELLEPAIEGLGYELVDLDYHVGKGGVLRVYIDHAEGVSLDDCEKVSHEISALLDVHDPIPDNYVLEVSSPGENRVLRTPKHFTDFAGNRVKVELKTLHEGRRRYAGRLLGVEGDELVVETDEGTVHVPVAEIAKVRLAPETAAAQRGK